ncbi:MAG: hypothetical protein K1X95_07430 [Acidimicrobiia bacterium]|nr:hypothetical protein [Acidimicrobiia bacterium]
MDTIGDTDWILRAVGSGVPGALAVFAVDRAGPGSAARLVLTAANAAYRGLFDAAEPVVGSPVASVLPGNDPQVHRIVAGVIDGDAFSAESWAIPAPAGTYSTGVAYCDWSIRRVDVFGTEAVVLLVTDATRRTETSLSMAEEVVRLRELA